MAKSIRKDTVMKIFSKPDEMEKVVSYRAMILTWIIINITFVVLAVISFMNNTINPISLTLLVAAEIIYFVIKFILRLGMTKGGREK